MRRWFAIGCHSFAELTHEPSYRLEPYSLLTTLGKEGIVGGIFALFNAFELQIIKHILLAKFRLEDHN
jgi:hypothetical protein